MSPVGLQAEKEAPLVLVIEDDEDMLEMYIGGLTAMGFRATGQRDGVSGVQAALALRPAAVLIDIGLPVLNGIEATRLIKEDPRTRDCLVVVMTGHGMKKFEEARAAGCDAFFCKPFATTALAEALRTLSSPAEQSKFHVLPEFRKCTCGREFSLKQWLALPACGRMHVPQRGVVVELRTCTCGSTMAVELDGLGVARIRTVPEESTREDAVRKTVLVADRDPHIRRLVAQFLAEQYVVEFADDGYSALDRVRLSPPSAIISEILIPRLDGLALCRAIKADPLTQRVPVLVISMLMANERAIQSGADAFLTKPLERASLVASVDALTDTQGRRGALPPLEKSAS